MHHGSATVRIAFDWAIRAFGKKHVYNMPIRALRCAEEAVELCQAYNADKATMLQLVEAVYSREVGIPDQEIGGVLMSINVLCAANDYDPDRVFERELVRVLAKPVEHFTKRNQDKIDLGLTA